MRIVVHGQQAFGKAVLEALLERGEDVVAVYAPPEGGAGRPAGRGRAAAGLPLVRPASFRDPAVTEQFRAFAPDLQVMAFVTLIVPAGFLVRAHARHDPVPPLAAAAAPRAQRHQLAGHQRRDRDRPHRVLAGRRHRHRRRAAAARRRPSRRPTPWAPSTSSACSRWAWRRCSRRWTWSAAGTAPRLPQDESLATYEAPCERVNARIDWGKPCRQLARPRPRLRPGAGRLDDLRRPGPAGLRGGAAAGRAMSRAWAARWERSSTSAPTGSAWCAPTAACA